MGSKCSSDDKELEREELDEKDGNKKIEFGPRKNRGCTDIVCCIIFTLYMIGMVIVAVIGVAEGEPKRLLYPTDSNGKICGIDIKNKPFLQFFDLTKCVTKNAKDPLSYVRKGMSCPTPQVCVMECPTKNQLGASLAAEKMVCVEGTKVEATMSWDEKMKLINAGKCSPYYLESKSAYYRCVPTAAVDAINSIANLKDASGTKINGSNIAEGSEAVEVLMSVQNLVLKIGEELKIVWKWILVGLVVSMVVSVIYIVLARWITFPLVIISAVGLLGVLGYSAYYSLVERYKYLVDTNTSQDIVWRISMTTGDFAQNKNCWLALGITVSILLVILVLLCCFLFSKVRFACGLIAEASKAVCSMLSTLFFPLLPWVIQIGWLGWFIAVLLYLMSNGTAQYQVTRNDTSNNLTFGDICDPKKFTTQYPNTAADCLFTKYVQNVNLLRLQIFHLVGWLWGANFIVAFAECTLAGAFASYYWTFNKSKDLPTLPVFGSMFKALFYHSGSLALGAAIIAIVQLIRITLEYIHKKLKETTDNCFADFLMKCLKCCFWCLNNCLRFINKNAYIMIAIYGKNFCWSAKEAISLLISEIGSTIAINGITSFILLLGKLLITGGVGVASFFWFSWYNAMLPEKLKYSIVPIVLCTLGAYLVTKLFFSVYDMGVDTLFLCYLEDVKQNNGKDKPYYMTESLQYIMDKHNKKKEKQPKPEEVPLAETV